MKLLFIIITFFTFNLNAVTYFDAKDGEKEYKEQNFSIAEKKFNSATISSSEKDPTLYYNLGNSYFQQKKFEEALSSYEKALSGNNKEFNSQVKYNIANTFVMTQKFEEALSYYKDAIKLDNKNKEAVVNYEIVKKMMKQQEQQQQKDVKKALINKERSNVKKKW
jgi:Ca-activated chloride channel family protein